MNGEYSVRAIARVRTDFPSKFGIPRQSGLVNSLEAKIVFEPEFRSPEALRGLSGFSHLWLIWRFSLCERSGWSPTVRPPMLGGNTRMGVFATRSPFRPNSIGLSSVRLTRIETHTEFGPVIYVAGADLADNTPLLDIKPYLPFSDSHPDAEGGFAAAANCRNLPVIISPALLDTVPAEKRSALLSVLENDPRPSYQDDPDRLYGFVFAGLEVKFRVRGGSLTVESIERT